MQSVLSLFISARLNSCLEEMRNIIGETMSERTMTDAIIDCNYNHEKALSYLLDRQG